MLKKLSVGDYVFHYSGAKRIEAVSVVTTPWQKAPRPDGYPTMNPDDPDEGWLVLVEPITTDVRIPYQRAAELIRSGNGGPLSRNGVPAQKYLSPLSEDDGQALLAEAGISHDGGEESLLGLPQAFWGGDVTDEAAIVKVRREQAELRRHLLGGRGSAACALCGKTLPAGLLVAAHIVPRRQITDAERRDFGSIAMLACVIGCDALFEWGYVTIDSDGLICPGRPAHTPDLRSAITALVGASCTAHSPATAARFAMHAEQASINASMHAPQRLRTNHHGRATSARTTN
ncbi:hypothetical protein [Rhodococcus sp. X156]|uniref:hypothetical protein n=1 Tax=Rhodococcus sp. X156 TaxID=2499145 RepID=UPI000FD96BF0|nr:hypothetical protein [Rhodococcus sp. X156]